jgi:Septum formation initiator
MAKRPVQPTRSATSKAQRASTQRAPAQHAPAQHAPAQRGSGERGSGQRASATRPARSRQGASNVPAASAAATPASGWLRGIRISWFAFVMMGLIVIGVLVVAPTLQMYLGQRQQISQLQQQNARTKSSIDALKTEAGRWSDPSYIKAQARDRLLYVMPGETSYLVIDDRVAPTAKADAPVSTGIQKTQSDWLATLLGSVLTAGTTNGTADSLDTAGAAG